MKGNCSLCFVQSRLEGHIKKFLSKVIIALIGVNREECSYGLQTGNDVIKITLRCACTDTVSLMGSDG